MKKRVRIPAAAAALAASLLGPIAGCTKADARIAKNVVLVSIDTLRADHLGCYGAKEGATPNIDRLAARGVRFEKAYSAVPVTTPSHATMLTGTFPPFHGVRSNGGFAVTDDRTTLAEMLKEKGYQTGAFVGAFPLDRQFGFGQGFDVYDDQIQRMEQSLSPYDSERRAGTVVDKALAWLRGTDAKKPFFLFVHVYDPHHPYAPPEPFKSKYAKDLYAGEVAYVDEQVGRIFRALEESGKADDTVIALVSDHGESLGEHGEATHMIFVYDATIRVPMILAGAGLPKGTVVNEPARLVDLVPTLGALTGAKVAAEVQGVDLAPAIAGKGSLPPKRAMYAESLLPQVQFDWAPLQSLRMGKWKYILAPQEELYDTEADPGETKNLFRKGPDGKPVFENEEQESAWRQLSFGMRKTLEEITSPDAGKAARSVDAESAKKLQSLGYLGSLSKGTATDGVDPLTLPDPKSRIEVFNRTEEALMLTAHGESEKAVAIYRSIMKDYPGESWVRMSLSRDLLVQKRFDEVLDILSKEEVAKMPSGSRGLAIAMRAGALEEKGNWGAALEEWNGLAAHGRENEVPSLKGKGNALVQLKRFDEARPLLEKAVAADPRDHDAKVLLGYALLGLGLESEGVARLGEARSLETPGADGKLDPRGAPRLKAANFYLRQGDKAKAATQLRTLVAEDPEQAKGEAAYLLANLGTGGADPNAALLASSREKSGRRDFAGAAADLEKVVAAGGGNAAVHYDLAVCYLNLRNGQEAHNNLVRCMKADAKFVPCVADFGYLSMQTGDKEKAERYYRRALDLQPGYYPALSRLGILLGRTGRFPEAIQLLERAVAAEPKNPDAHHNLAVTYKAAGRMPDAQRAEAEARRLEGERGR